MFTSAILKIEPGLISNLSMGVVMVFGYVINRWKKLTIIALCVGALSLVSVSAFAFGGVGGGCGTLCLAGQQNYSTYYGGAQCGGGSPINYNNGSYPFQNYQSPWSNPSVYSQNLPYSPYGQCINCQTAYNYGTNPIYSNPVYRQ